MKLKEPHLSRSEEQKYRLRLQQLQTEGHDVAIPEEWSDNADALAIKLSKPWENVLLDLGITGEVGYYAVRVRMIALESNLTLLEHEITTDRDDQIELLDAGLRENCRVFRSLGLEQKEVLNSRFENPLRFHSRGHVVEGWIVAAGSRPVPQEFRNGSRVRLQLMFLDQFDRKIGAEADLSVRRLKQKSAPVQPRTGLFEPAENQKSPELSVSEQSMLRYLHITARERRPARTAEAHT